MLRNIIKAAIFTPTSRGWGLPLLMWGDPGVAKTAILSSIGAEYAMPCEVLSPGERGEGAFGVVPVPDAAVDDPAYLRGVAEMFSDLTSGKKPLSADEAVRRASAALPRPRKFLTYPLPEWTRPFYELQRGIVLVDEATSTPPGIQAAVMGLIHDRRIGGALLPPGVRVLGAANPPEIAAGGYELALPMQNRFGHLRWDPPEVDDHVQFMLGGSPAPTVTDAGDEEKRVMAAWPSAWAAAVGLETAFLSRRGALKNRVPAPGTTSASGIAYAWPSDRTWELATRALAGAYVHDLSEAEREIFVEGFIGTGAAGEWFNFIREQDLPDPAKLLDGKVRFAHSPQRIDRTLAVYQACVSLLTSPSCVNRDERANVLWGMFEAQLVAKADVDTVVPAARAMIAAKLHLTKPANRPLALLNPILSLAGITGGRV